MKIRPVHNRLVGRDSALRLVQAWLAVVFATLGLAVEPVRAQSGDACAISGDLILGSTVNGTLSAADKCVDSSGTYADRWRLTLSSASHVRIEMSSTQILPMFFLVNANDPTGIPINLNGVGGPKVTVEKDLPAGVYHIWTMTLTPGTSGAYQLASIDLTDTDSVVVTTSANPTNGGTSTGGGTFTKGAPVTVTASPAAGYRFVRWMDGSSVVSTSPNYTFTSAVNRSLVANFALATRTLSISGGGDGSGRVISSNGSINCIVAAGVATGSCSVNAVENSEVSLAATPETGFSFTGWSGACSGSTAACVVRMTEERSVVATFTANPRITLSHDSLKVVTQGGETTDVITIQITNTGTGNLADLSLGPVVYSNGADWISASLSSTGSPSIQVRLIADRLPGGTYTVLIPVVSSSAGVPPKTVRVTMTVVEPGLGGQIDDLLGRAGMPETSRRYLDVLGNKDGGYNLGDLLAYLTRASVSLTPAVMSQLMNASAEAPTAVLQ